MVRACSGLLFFLLLSGCASKPIFSSELLLKSAREDLESANKMAESVKDTFKQYLGAHRHMIKTRSLEDKAKMRELHQLMKAARVEGKKVFALRKEIQKDVAVLEKELKATSSISEGSAQYQKVEPQVKTYGMGEPHPGLKSVQEGFDTALNAYTGRLSEHSGYLTDSKTLKSQFDSQLGKITERLDKMTEKASGETALVDMIGQVKLQLSDLQSKFSGELPEKSQKVLLFPNMISYSVMDRLTTVGEQIEELEKKIP